MNRLIDARHTSVEPKGTARVLQTASGMTLTVVIPDGVTPQPATPATDVLKSRTSDYFGRVVRRTRLVIDDVTPVDGDQPTSVRQVTVRPVTVTSLVSGYPLHTGAGYDHSTKEPVSRSERRKQKRVETKLKRALRRGLVLGPLGAGVVASAAGCAVTYNDYRGNGAPAGPDNAQGSDGSTTSPRQTATPDANNGLKGIHDGTLYKDKELALGDEFTVPEGAGIVMVQGDLEVKVGTGANAKWVALHDSVGMTGSFSVYVGEIGGDKQLTFRAKVGGGDVQYDIRPGKSTEWVKGDDLLLMLQNGCENLKSQGCNMITVTDLGDLMPGGSSAKADHDFSGIGTIYEDKELAAGDPDFEIPADAKNIIVQGDAEVSFDGGNTWTSLHDSKAQTGSISVFRGGLNGVQMKFRAEVGGIDVQYNITDGDAFKWDFGNLTDLMLEQGCGNQAQGCMVVNVYDLNDMAKNSGETYITK